MSDSDFHAKLTDQTADQVYFALAMFPYPSGAGLHVGHAENFSYVDIMARFQRMQGKTVINPIGRDAFGLPTENYALKQGKPAHIVTQENINNFIAQCKMLDISYDRDREINTSSPEYYKRTQWIFCKLFEAWLVYRKDALVNRCNGCQTVLANDQVKEGKCERCETEIIQKKHPQWFIKITDYAERLIQDLDLVNRPEETKTHQKNRIGKSEGIEVDFVIEGKQWWNNHRLCSGDGYGHYTRCIIYNQSGEFIMLWQKKWSCRVLPWGKVEVGEEIDSSILREVKEETNINLKSIDHVCSFKAIWWDGWKSICNVYQGQTDQDPIIMEPEKHTKIAWWKIQLNPLSVRWFDIVVNGCIVPHQERIYSLYPIGAMHQISAHTQNVQWELLKQNYNYLSSMLFEEERDYIAYFDKKTFTYMITDVEKYKKESHYITLYINQGKYFQQGFQKTQNIDLVQKITIYTTRPETIYGVTALMLAPENESLDHMLDPQMRQQVLLYRTQTSAKTNLQRQHTDKNKSGLFSGLYARHPLTEEMIPVRYADYVLADYATGAVMFVPAHDERDYEFAQTINAQQSDSILSITQVIVPSFTKSYHSDLVQYRRDSVRAIIKHPDEDRYLFLTADDGRVRYVGWWVDEGLTVFESLVKEISEETGYTDVDIQHHIITTHFAKHVKSKGINSYGYCHYYYCELKSLDQDPISLEEYSKHQPVWMTAEQFHQHAQDIIFVRQYRQAKKYDLYLGDGVMINCGSQLDMLPVTQAKELIIQSIEQKGVWHRKINYKLRDRSVSRQRYRWSPIPIYYTFEDNEDGKYTADYPHPDKSKRIPHLIPQTELPVILPLDLQNYKPAGKSPLEDHPTFKYYQQWDQTYLRECDTLDTFMCSTYYYLRFLDPHNTDHVIDPALDKVAMPIDFYMGGKEHTVWHLLYSRFVYKFLYDQWYVNHPEPFARLIHQGIVLAPDGRKMSKRRWNVINPSEVIAKYGVDVTRTYIAFMWPVEQDKCRDDNALWGVKRFLDRVTKLVDMVWQTEYSQDTQSKIHQTIKGVTEDIINLKYNTAISKLMILTNHFYEVKKLTQSDYEILLLLLAPFATQLTSMVWKQLGHTNSIHKHSWPVYQESYISSGSAVVAVQINGKMRGTIQIQSDSSQDQVLSMAQADPHIAKYIQGTITKIIFVPNKILNLIVSS